VRLVRWLLSPSNLSKMDPLISLFALFVIATLAAARPLSLIDSYGGNPQPLHQVNEDGQVVARDHYPLWLGDEQDTAPWELSTLHGDGSRAIPSPGITRRYDFTITRDRLAPDGVFRDMFTINGQFPGPLIEANWGDMIEVTVHNNITGPEEPTSMHWHGILQRESPWADGAIGVSQKSVVLPSDCADFGNSRSLSVPLRQGTRSPIVSELTATAPLSTMHITALNIRQVLLGPCKSMGHRNDITMLILVPLCFRIGWALAVTWHGSLKPEQADAEVQYHAQYTEIVESVLGTDYSKLPPISDSGLINGRGRFDCLLLAPGTPCNVASEYATFNFQSKKLHRLRLINHGADGKLARDYPSATSGSWLKVRHPKLCDRRACNDRHCHWFHSGATIRHHHSDAWSWSARGRPGHG